MPTIGVVSVWRRHLLCDCEWWQPTGLSDTQRETITVTREADRDKGIDGKTETLGEREGRERGRERGREM
jgi:hypothetical protein